MIIWFTGQPGSGKTTLSKALNEKIGNKFIHIDGDEIRDITNNYDYSQKGRMENMEFISNLCKLFSKKNLSAIISAVSPQREIRENIKNNHKMIEIYVHTTKTRGKEDRFVANYQPPENDYLDLDTSHSSVDLCITKILQYYKEYEKK